MSDQSARVQAIFFEAVEGHAPEAWPAFLDSACAGDAELRAGVERLLRARSEMGSFHEPPRPAPAETVDDPVTERPGTVIGPYKLIEEVGEGGMGSVWMAQQTEPVKRLVALKVIKPGMDSRQVIARFGAERQALALMDHPNIARVFDAGTTAAGRPYFVMELVKGVPITKFCDERRMSPRERLELFVPVCLAIQHAHQKGVIHRDIKPSNVLVALYDGRPVPKVIDFGVAKATGQQLTDHTLVTGFGAVVGTLQYMSPEQAETNQLDIDTRSDIYSLGVLLYELLTGSTPLDKRRVKEAAVLEVLRLIREEEPQKPSTRLSSTEGTPSVAACRGLEPKKLSGLVRGELDWIVMKALAKERERRYETANGLAADVRRYLADEPVQAGPPSASYRLRKFLRRNRARVAAGCLVLLVVLLAGGGVGWVLWDRATQHAARTVTTERTVSVALARATQLAEQAQKMRSVTSAEADAVLVVWRQAEDALAQAEAALTTGADDDGLRQEVADVQAQLDSGRAQTVQERARALRKEKLFRDLDEARLAGSVWIIDRPDRATSAAKYAEAFASYGLDVTRERGGELSRRIAAEEPEVREALIATLFDWGWAAFQEDRTKRAGRDLAGLVAMTTDSNGWHKRFTSAVAKHDRPALRSLSVEARRSSLPPSSLVHLARNLFIAGEREEGLALLRWGRGRHPRDFWLHFELGGLLQFAKSETRTAVELEEAIGCWRAALALRPKTSAVHVNLGNAMRDKGHLDEAIAAYRQAIRFRNDNAVAHHNLGLALRDKGLDAGQRG